MKFYFLGQFNINGKSQLIDPLYFDGTVPNLVSAINNLLPERKKMHHNKLEWLNENSFDFINSTEVSVTFVDEGAGYRNAIAYFICDTDNKPTTIAHISECYFIFPNCSKIGSGGGLFPGDTIRLPYTFDKYSVGNLEYITPTNYVFPAGKTIGFIIYPNGWTGVNVNKYVIPFTSSFYHNPERAEELKYHTVCLQIPNTERLLLGFEDINRESNGCDHDFNDAILLVNCNLSSVGKGFIDVKGFEPNVDEPNMPTDYNIGYKKAYTHINGKIGEVVITLFIPKTSQVVRSLHNSNKKQTNNAYVKEILVVQKRTNRANTNEYISRRVDTAFSWFDPTFTYTKKTFVSLTDEKFQIHGISFFDSFKEAADYDFDPYKI
jgi:hypothetical protein